MTSSDNPFAAPEPGYGPPPGPGALPPAPYGGWAPAPQTDGTAIAALVVAICSFVVFPVVPAIVALVLASSARRDIDASGGRLGGEGLVTAARVVAWTNIGLSVGAVVLFVALLTMPFAFT